MKVISRAVTKLGGQGLTPPDWMLNQTLTVEQALRLITIDAAYGTFQEDIKGSIKVGKLADLVVLSDNPLTVPEDSLTDIEVLMTMVGGRIEFVKDGSGFPEPDTTAVIFSSSDTGLHLICGIVRLRNIQEAGLRKSYVETPDTV
jgi:hypothetical protein